MSAIGHLRRRRPRARLAWLGLWALILQQLALVAYACPAEQSTASATAIMAGCEGMEAPDPDAPALCNQHCQRDHVATSELKSAQVPPLVMPAVQFALIEALLPPIQSQHYRDVPVCLSDPPAAQRFCSLQI